MKTRILYTCEICGIENEYVDQISRCEARGHPKEPTVGLIFGNASNQSHRDKDMTFAVKDWSVVGHGVYAGLWACRDTGVGDTLGEETCGSGNSLQLGKQDIPDVNHPTFKRLVAFLRTVPGIEITCWDGTKAIPLGTFLMRGGGR